MKSIYWFVFVCVGIFLGSCDLERVGNSKALAEEMRNRKIKRVTNAQMNVIVDDWGQRLVQSAQKELEAKINQPNACNLESMSGIDSLEKRYGASISLLRSDDLTNISPKEREIVEAYQYNAENNLPQTTNIQKLGDSVMIYNSPIELQSIIAKTCIRGNGLVLWRVRFSKNEIIKRVDEKSLTKINRL